MRKSQPLKGIRRRRRRAAPLGLFLLVLFGPGLLAVADSLETELAFDPAGLRFTRSGEYDAVSLEGCESTYVPGEPQLPTYGTHILLPSGARVDRVEVLEAQTLRMSAERPIRPAQSPRILSGIAVDGKLVPPKPSIYASGEPYPPELVRHAGTSQLGGFTVAAVTVYPLQYAPAEGSCVFHSRVRIRITYTTGSPSSPSVQRLSRHTSARYQDAIQKLVCNHECIDAFSPARSFQTQMLLLDRGDRDEYVIITDEALVSAFQPLADWKTKKGVPARIVTTSWIDSSYEGVDTQERIRAFLRDSFTERGTLWVLLGGDVDKVPARKAYALDCQAGFDADEDNIPCDLYYSDLDGTWNAGGNPDVFGEVADEVDLLPEVFVGRAPASTAAQAETFVRKVLTYEKSPPPDYLVTMLFAAEILWSDPYTDQGIAKDRIDDAFVPSRFAITKLYQRDGNESPATVLAAMNEGRHIINHDGHAWHNVLSVGSRSIRNADMDQLANGPEYSILYSIGCWSAAFDRDSIAERFVNAPDGGGVAFIGNSRYGWGALGQPGFGYSDRFDRSFYELLFDHDEYRIGANLALSKAVYAPFSHQENVYRWCQYQINLIGDPEMPIWTDRPASLDVRHPPSVAVGWSELPVTVLDSGGALAGAMVCVMKEDEVYEAAPTDGTGRVVFAISPMSPTDKLHVTVTAHNYLPYEGTVDVLSEPGYIAASACTIDDARGNGDGRLTPGESAELAVELQNYGSGDVAGVTATLEAISGDVTITDATASYGDIGAGARASSADNFSISVPATRANGETVYLSLTAEDAHQSRWESTLALEVTTPVLVCELLGVEDGHAGNGDGLPEPGETVTLFARIENRGLAAARDVVATLTSDDAFIAAVESARDLGTLLPGESRVGAFDVTIADGCPTPRFPTVSATFSADGGYDFTGSLELTVGETGFTDDVESASAGWSAPGGGNLWHRTSHRAHEGSTSWYCGIEGQWSYPSESTSVLLSAPFVLGRDPVLSLWVWYDLALYGTTGLFVEVDDGAGWEKLDFIGSGGALNPLLMGHDWAEYRYDLSRYAPGTTVQLRFRFVSDSEPGGEGIYVDTIEVTAGGEPSAVAEFIRGDADADGAITISDPIAILGCLFLHEEEPTCFDATDANDDGVIDLSDAVRILLHLFGGRTFEPPLGVCASDPTPDGLDCRAAPPCR